VDRDGDGYADGTTRDGYTDGTVDGTVRDPRDGVDDHTLLGVPNPTTADRYDDSTVRDTDTDTPVADARPPAAAYRHTAPVTDPDGVADPADPADPAADRYDPTVDRHDPAADEYDRTVADRDGDGVPDDREQDSVLRKLKDRLGGRVDERDATVEDRP
jgi:hypothetical protein